MPLQYKYYTANANGPEKTNEVLKTYVAIYCIDKVSIKLVHIHMLLLGTYG